MSGQVMCFCKACQGRTIGLKTGLSFGAHLFNWLLIVLTGALWIVPYILIVAVSGSVRCTKCGGKSKQL
jgi:hypothetical protein